MLEFCFLGGMGDYNYAFHGCMELTLELSCCKYPPSRQLPTFWEENKQVCFYLNYSLLIERLSWIHDIPCEDRIIHSRLLGNQYNRTNNKLFRRVLRGKRFFKFISNDFVGWSNINRYPIGVGKLFENKWYSEENW